jgi:hypothetical protein
MTVRRIRAGHDSKANSNAAIVDNLIMFIVLLPVGDFRAAFAFPYTSQKMGRN